MKSSVAAAAGRDEQRAFSISPSEIKFTEKIFNYGMLESPLTRFTTSHHNPSFPVIPLAVLVAGLLIAAAGRLDAGRFMGPQSGEFPDEPFEPIALEAHQCHGPFHPKNYPTKELYFPRVPYIYNMTEI